MRNDKYAWIFYVWLFMFVPLVAATCLSGNLYSLIISVSILVVSTYFVFKLKYRNVSKALIFFIFITI